MLSTAMKSASVKAPAKARSRGKAVPVKAKSSAKAASSKPMLPITDKLVDADFVDDGESSEEEEDTSDEEDVEGEIIELESTPEGEEIDLSIHFHWRLVRS